MVQVARALELNVKPKTITTITMELSTTKAVLDIMEGTEAIKFTIITGFTIEVAVAAKGILTDTLFANRNYLSLLDMKAFEELEKQWQVFQNKNSRMFGFTDNQLNYLTIISA